MLKLIIIDSKIIMHHWITFYTIKVLLIMSLSAMIKGYLFRKNRMPNVLYSMQRYLQHNSIVPCITTEDGRVNSCMDEDKVIATLSACPTFTNRIFKPKVRMWYDILVYDYQFGWIPVNIKSTTTTTSDNTGNLAMCVYAYTDCCLDLYSPCHNGAMSRLLIDKLQARQFNTNKHKDYYFIVINKSEPGDIIINSVKGLQELTPNINNLPFQVMWKKNRNYTYKPIEENVQMLLSALRRPAPSWKESFMSDIRSMNL